MHGAFQQFGVYISILFGSFFRCLVNSIVFNITIDWDSPLWSIPRGNYSCAGA
jgi:hypothetical protein